jgi:hypothetical protein
MLSGMNIKPLLLMQEGLHKRHYFFHLLTNTRNNNDTLKLPTTPTAASRIVLNKSAVAILASTMVRVPPAVPARRPPEKEGNDMAYSFSFFTAAWLTAVITPPATAT